MLQVKSAKSDSTDIYLSVHQEKLIDVQIMIETWEKSGIFKEKAPIEKLNIFRELVDKEILLTMESIDAGSKIRTLDDLIGKVNSLLLKKKEKDVVESSDIKKRRCRGKFNFTKKSVS